jgi:hypothetical protein
MAAAPHGNDERCRLQAYLGRRWGCKALGPPQRRQGGFPSTPAGHDARFALELFIERFSFAREGPTNSRKADTEAYRYGALHQGENRSR